MYCPVCCRVVNVVFDGSYVAFFITSLGMRELDALLSLVCNMCCLSYLFTHPLGVIGSLCSVIVFIPGNLLHLLSLAFRFNPFMSSFPQMVH